MAGFKLYNAAVGNPAPESSSHTFGAEQSAMEQTAGLSDAFGNSEPEGRVREAKLRGDSNWCKISVLS